MNGRSLVAWNLRRLRTGRLISQDDLAHVAGVERAYVGHVERGTKNPTVDTLDKLATALECHLSEFFVEPPDDAQAVAPLRAGRRKK